MFLATLSESVPLWPTLHSLCTLLSLLPVSFPPPPLSRYFLQAWRLSGKEKVALAPADIGKFYRGDCYLLQYTFVRDRKNEYLMFLWVGSASIEVSG